MGPQLAPDLNLEGLVHDLNNVFETISEAAELLEDDPKWTSLAAVIHRGVSRGRRIVGSYSASARGEQEFDLILDNSIEFALDLLNAVHAAPVEFVRKVAPGIRITGSATSWERVFLNLFLNAAQAMKHGGVIEIRATCGEDGIEIRVSDNGCGIPAHILPRIFDPHFSTRSSNSGLGLHIVKSLVTENGGTVHAENRKNASGAAFSIHVPAA